MLIFDIFDIIEIFLRLILAHVICDFYLQPNSWVEQRNSKHEKSPKLFLHALFHGLISYLLLGNIYLWWIIPAITLSHLFIDIWKSYQKNSVHNFIYDQLAHFAIIGLISYLTHHLPLGFPVLSGKTGITVLSIVTLGLLFLRPASIFIQLFMDIFDFDKTQLNTLSNAGKYIGYFERSIILACIITEAYAALGFLIASKSLLRFSDRNKSTHQQTEYVLVGSLLSWAISIIAALVLKTLLSHF